MLPVASKNIELVIAAQDLSLPFHFLGISHYLTAEIKRQICR